MKNIFHYFAKKSSQVIGRPWVFTVACIFIILWLVSGPFFGFSDTWQLIMNTATSIITFLIVFLIQNTQYRDSEAFHIKLDELLSVHKKADKSIINLEDLSDEQLKHLEEQYQRKRQKSKVKK